MAVLLHVGLGRLNLRACCLDLLPEGRQQAEHCIECTNVPLLDPV